MYLYIPFFYPLHIQTGYNDEEDDEPTVNTKKPKVQMF